MSSFFRKPFGIGNNSSGSAKSSPTKSTSVKSTSSKSFKSFASPVPSTLSATSGSGELDNLSGSLRNASLSSSLGMLPKHLLPAYTEQNILNGDIRRFVTLPKYINRDEWISSQIFEFFTLINSLYDTLTEFCTEKGCGYMSVPINEFSESIALKWSSDLINQFTKGLCLRQIAETLVNNTNERQSASCFIDHALSWIDRQLEDPQNFPLRTDGQLKSNFEEQLGKPIFTILFLILTHIYLNHFDVLIGTHLVGHLNAVFIHFTTFAEEFQLIAPPDLSPMKPLISALLNSSARNC